MGCSSDERKIVYFAQKTVEVCSGIALHWLKYVFFFRIFQRKFNQFLLFQRRDVSVLKEFLPTKYEYDIFIRMTDVQVCFSYYEFSIICIDSIDSID